MTFIHLRKVVANIDYYSLELEREIKKGDTLSFIRFNKLPNWEKKNWLPK